MSAPIRLDRTVTLSILFAIFVQTAGALIWGGAARDVPLAQDEARYEIELLRGGEVIANYETTLASLTLPATALAGPQERLDVRIYQISRIAGRGYPLETHIKI